MPEGVPCESFHAMSPVPPSPPSPRPAPKKFNRGFERTRQCRRSHASGGDVDQDREAGQLPHHGSHTPTLGPRHWRCGGNVLAPLSHIHMLIFNSLPLGDVQMKSGGTLARHCNLLLQEGDFGSAPRRRTTDSSLDMKSNQRMPSVLGAKRSVKVAPLAFDNGPGGGIDYLSQIHDRHLHNNQNCFEGADAQ